MLQEFLDLDQPLRTRSQEKALLGVRKAQVKLAAYYLAAGEEQKARRISRDMAGEPPERLRVIRELPRVGRHEGLLGDHRPRPQLRVHAARGAGAPRHVLRLARRGEGRYRAQRVMGRRGSGGRDG